MKTWKHWCWLFGLMSSLAACVQDPAPTSIPATPPPATAVTPTTAVPTPVKETATPMPEATTGQQPFTWPLPATPYHAISRAQPTDAEQLARQALERNYPPDRDDITLFIAYQGAALPTGTATPVAEPLPLGTRQNITVNNTDLNTNNTPEFELKFVSEHAYFWFDTTPGLLPPTPAQLEAMGAGFDEIYENSRLIFGSESSPGIDGDPRIHIVNASPLNLCDVSLASADQCWLAGYFSSHDLVPQSVNPASNAREMFVMNGRSFGLGGYLDTLAHEFRHMIEENYDVNDWDWEVEGSAMLAEELLGYPGDGVVRANYFLQNPDQQLNRWSEEDTLPRYGQGYLFSRYLYNRLGDELYQAFAAHPADAFAALDELAGETGTTFSSGLALWLDWLVALAIHNQPGVDEKYTLAPDVNTAVTHPLTADTQTTVYPFAADYYQLTAGTAVHFTGSNHIPLLPVQPTSGSHMWVSNRANYSAARLSRAFDLSGASSATLTYDVYRDIETGYDFAYLTLSTDGGQSWQPLAGAVMQGADVADDPSESALAGRFYTGRAEGWVEETVDLTPFAGQEVLLRFEYVTDPILTYGGLALDNLAIPEIGFYDDAESGGGWQAEGFVRATGYLPAQWHLILIQFTDKGPAVTPVELSPENTAVITPEAGSQPPLLIVAATAPMTLQTAHYQLFVNQAGSMEQ